MHFIALYCILLHFIYILLHFYLHFICIFLHFIAFHSIFIPFLLHFHYILLHFISFYGIELFLISEHEGYYRWYGRFTNSSWLSPECYFGLGCRFGRLECSISVAAFMNRWEIFLILWALVASHSKKYCIYLAKVWIFVFCQ